MKFLQRQLILGQCLALLLTLGLVACSGGGPGAIGDAFSVEMTPAPDATNVATNTEIFALFDESLDPATISTDTVRLESGGNAVAGSVLVTQEGNKQKVIFVPAQPLVDQAEYTVKIMGNEVQVLGGSGSSGVPEWDAATPGIQNVPLGGQAINTGGKSLASAAGGDVSWSFKTGGDTPEVALPGNDEDPEPEAEPEPDPVLACTITVIGYDIQGVAPGIEITLQLTSELGKTGELVAGWDANDYAPVPKVASALKMSFDPILEAGNSYAVKSPDPVQLPQSYTIYGSVTGEDDEIAECEKKITVKEPLDEANP